METSENATEQKPEKKRSGKGTIVFLIVTIILFLLLIGYMLYKPADKPAVITEVTASSTATPILSPTCQTNMQLDTPEGLNPPTRLIVILYDPLAKVSSPMDLTDGERISNIPEFVSRIIPDLMGPGDEISVFQLGYDTYPAARVTRQYSYLLIYPQLYVAPNYDTLTPLPPTGVPTPGYGEVATKNAYVGTATQRVIDEALNSAVYNCEVEFYNQNVRSTATAWKQMQAADINSISTAEVNDFSTVTPGRVLTSEMAFGGLYTGLYFASVDIKADCSKYDECDLIIVDDLHYYGKHNPDHYPIDLTGVNTYVIQPTCRDINQPDCTDLQGYWTPELQGFGVTNISYWNGLRAELNLLNNLGR